MIMEFRITTAGMIAFTMLAASVDTFAAEGRTPGQFVVSQTGSAHYSIPIWTPPGPRGVQPHLALTYDSQSGIDTLGIGWHVGGLGAITRCTKTYAQDTVPAPVALVATDGYCINGNRLRLVTGTYGTAGSTYQTEIADFSNITAVNTAGNGPSYFTVQGNDGLTYEYGYTDANGNGANSQVLATGSTTASEWLLSKIIDRAGNNLVINYTLLTGAAVPNTILWTPTSEGASTYLYTLQFNYSSNVPQSSLNKYIGGTSVSNNKLLSSIAISSSGTIVKDYFLGYQASPTTGRNELVSVEECADSAKSNCLLPTAITYQNGSAGVSTTATTAVSSSGALLAARYDFNGDGYPDLVYNPTGNGPWYVAFGSATGYGTPVNTSITGVALFGNVTGGNKDGILANNAGTWWYYTWNGSSFTGASTGIAYDTATYGYQLADVDGDGLPDLIDLDVVYNSITKTSGGTVYTRLNTSTGSTVSFSSTVTAAYSTGRIAGAQLQTPDYGGSKLRRYDFDGDGRDDLVLQVITGSGNYSVSTYELISTGTTFNATLIASASGATYLPVFFTDWNDDACTDFVNYNTSTSATLYISGCNGSLPASYPVGNVVAAMDWDGDGRTDLVVANGSTLGVYLSTGAAPAALLSTSIPYSSSCAYVTMDANADGLDDLGCWSQTAPNPLTYRVHNGAGQPADLVSSIKDGYGNSVSPTYVSLQSDYSNYSDAVFPYQDYIGPLYVVNEAVFSDPSNMPSGTYNQQFYYYGAWTNLQGRGFQAFYATRMLDSRNSLYDYQYYGRSFPWTGIKWQDIVSNGTFYPSESTGTFATLAAATLSSTTNEQRYFPYFTNVTSKTWEVGGTENGDLITTASTNYAYDSYGNATTVATTVTDNDPGSPYLNDTWTSTTVNTIAPDASTWCLGLPTETQVTNSSTAPGGAAITRTVSYISPDYTNCRQTQQVVEPSSPTYKVTAVYGYDAFGNINSQTVTGVGMAARTTSANWGTTGQFPTTLTNALSQVTQNGFDPNTGLLLNSKDPNGVTTSWQYDSFTRPIKQVNPDGTALTWAYNPCATGGCVNANNVMTVVKTHLNADGTTLRIDNTYLDELDRTLVTSGQMLNGAYDRNEVQYDNLGRVHLQGLPCTFVSCTQYWVTNTYDVLNRLTESQRPISASNSTLQSTNYTYQGRTSTVKDAQNKTWTAITKVTGNVGRTLDPNGYYINFTHDAFGSELSAVDSLSNTLHSVPSYSYGLRAFPSSSADMDLGARTYTYDALGELTAYTDAKSQSFSATYDALSRPLVRTEPDLTTTWTWGASAASYNIGKLASVSAASSVGTLTHSYGYDSLSRKVSETIAMPAGGSFRFNYFFDSNTGFLHHTLYPVSYPSTYQLPLARGHHYGIFYALFNNDVPTTVYWQANTMNPRGQVTQETTEDLSGDPQIVTSRTYDAVTGWVGSILSANGSGSGLQNEAYQYDLMGNVIQRQNNNAGLTENFYYDNLYRLDHSTLAGTTNLQMCYDNTAGACTANLAGMGNITSRSDIASGAAWTYDPVHKHQVTQAGDTSHTYTYDANGNAATRNGTLLGWTSYNYPSSVGTATESASFDYGPDRERWRMIYNGSSGTETTYYATPAFEAVVTSAGTDYRHYIYANGRPVVVISRTTAGAVNVRSLLVDHQGSISSIVTDSAGTIDVSESFTAYGNRREASTWSGAPTSAERTTMDGVSRQGYTFQTVLGSMGLNHMNGRVQDSITGRFLSADPNISDPGNTQTYNRYTYVNNNPLTYTDPTGFAVDSPKPVDPCDVPGGCLQGITVTASRGSSGGGYVNIPVGNPVVGSSSGGGQTLDEITVTGQRSHAPHTNLTPPPITLNVIDYTNYLTPSSNPAHDQNPCPLSAPTGKYRTAPGVNASFDPTTAGMLSNALANLNQQGITPVITSGFRSPALQAALGNANSPYVITPALVSWHEVGAAVDFGPNSNAGNFDPIVAAMTQVGFVWGGTFRTPDVPHFQSQPAGTSPTAAQVQSCTPGGH
jgi:RHS repeat-associated protein